MWGSVQEGASCPDVQSFLSSVNHFITNLNSARVNIDRKFQLQHIDLPDAISQLSSPADYTAAGRTVDHTTVPSPVSSIILRNSLRLCSQPVTVSWWRVWRALSPCGPIRSSRCWQRVSRWGRRLVTWVHQLSWSTGRDAWSLLTGRCLLEQSYKFFSCLLSGNKTINLLTVHYWTQVGFLRPSSVKPSQTIKDHCCCSGSLKICWIKVSCYEMFFLEI